MSLSIALGSENTPGKPTSIGIALEVNSANILVVEDNDDDSLMLTRQLQKAQIEESTKIIEDGNVALDFLLGAVKTPLAIFLDLHLPGLSGVELLRKVRKDDRLRLVPVIIMTGSEDPKDLEECTALGITAFLQKPVGLSAFVKTVAPLFPRAVLPG